MKRKSRWLAVRLITQTLLALAAPVLAAAHQQQDSGVSAGAVRTLLDAGDYTEAERQASLWVGEVERRSGPESVDVATALDLQVEALVGNGKAGAADTVALAERSLRVKQRLLGPLDPQLAPSLDNLGSVHRARGEMGAAVPFHERAVSLRRRANPPDSIALADSLDRFSLPLILAQRFDDARRALEESARIREANPDRSPLEQARTLHMTALLHRYDGRFDVAVPLLERALEIRRRLLAADHPEVRSALQLRGELSLLQGRIAAARDDWLAALGIAERTLRPDHPDIAQLLRLIAITSRAFGDIAGARELLERALPIAQQALGPCEQGVPDLLGDLAGIAGYEGDYERSQKLTAAQLGHYERCLGPNDQRTATAVHNQAVLAAEMGDLQQAERLQSRAIRMWSAGLGPDHPYVARGLDALAAVMADSGRLTRSRVLYERALTIRQKTLGADHPDVAWTLTNIAQVMGRTGAVQLALARLTEAIGIYQRAGTGVEPDHLARALVLRGTLEERQGNYRAARASFTEAAALRERIFGAAHPLVAAVRAEMASADLALGALDAALDLALDAERIGRDHLRFTIRYLPERQAMEYAARRPRGLDLALSIVSGDPTRKPSAVLDAVIQSRGVVLDELAARAQSAIASGPALAPLTATVMTTRRQFANLLLRSFQGEEPVSRDILDEARARTEEAERALAEQSVTARAEYLRARVRLEDVQRALPPDTALISYARYDRTTFTSSNARTTARTVPSYIALVIAPGIPTAIVPLGSAESIESAMRSWREQVDGRSIAAGVAPAEAERTYRATASRLRQRIWDPVAKQLSGVSRVFVVPDGALNLVSFAALPIDSTRYLVETGPVVHLLPTERDLVRSGTEASGQGLLALGGPAYDLVSAPAVGDSRRSGCGTAGALRFDDLPGSREEIKDVSRIWAANPPADSGAVPAAHSVVVLSGNAATKAALERAAAGRRVVHLATHGFFLGSQCGPAVAGTRGVGGLTTARPGPVARRENPLLVAGLALAGANGGRRGRRDEGILTAEEVTSLNLQGTEWAVLSACDTGLGEIRAGEGVFGLRRAFQIAGVRTIIMSLWSVEDRSTRDWMRILYEGRLKQRLDTVDAVRNADVLVLQRRRQRGESTHPFYWAAFVAAGDWR